MVTKQIPIELLFSNTGQIPGLPQNPRTRKDEAFQKLKDSIEDDPEMLQLRELIVFPLNDIFIVIAGNQRLDAQRDLGYTECHCKVLDKKTPVEKLRAYAIKDNVSTGDHNWDLLATEWDQNELEGWGLEIEEEEPEENLTESKSMFYLSVRCTNEKKCSALQDQLTEEGYHVKMMKRKKVISSEKLPKKKRKSAGKGK